MAGVPYKINPISVPYRNVHLLKFVAADSEFFCLETIWTASGQVWGQTPSDYMIKRGRRFVDTQAARLGLTPDDLIADRNGLIWATPMVARNYTQWISDDFAADMDYFANLAAKAIREESGHISPGPVDRMPVRLTGMTVRKDFSGAVDHYVVAAPTRNAKGKIQNAAYAILTNCVYEQALNMSAQQIKDSLGVRGDLVRDYLTEQQNAMVASIESGFATQAAVQAALSLNGRISIDVAKQIIAICGAMSRQIAQTSMKSLPHHRRGA